VIVDDEKTSRERVALAHEDIESYDLTEDHVWTAQERINPKNIEKGIREMTIQGSIVSHSGCRA
jgi:hypothetical protein